jgi:hypothetical protein
MSNQQPAAGMSATDFGVFLFSLLSFFLSYRSVSLGEELGHCEGG